MKCGNSRVREGRRAAEGGQGDQRGTVLPVCSASALPRALTGACSYKHTQFHTDTHQSLTHVSPQRTYFLSVAFSFLWSKFNTHPRPCTHTHTAVLLGRDGYLLEPTVCPKWSQASCAVWIDTGLPDRRPARQTACQTDGQPQGRSRGRGGAGAVGQAGRRRQAALRSTSAQGVERQEVWPGLQMHPSRAPDSPTMTRDQ